MKLTAIATRYGAVIMGGVLTACTFLVDFEDRPVAARDGSVEEPDSEAPPLDAALPPHDGTVVPPDAQPSNPCTNKPQNFKWGTTPFQRCCRGMARDFAVFSDVQDCNVCGFSCGTGQRCVKSLQGPFFCVGCGPPTAEINEACPTNCCSNFATDGNVFPNAQDQQQGVCTASDCGATGSPKCDEANCPFESVCQTSNVTSYYCTYVN
jgi:hypothetical protein